MKHIIIGFFIFLLFSFTPRVEAYDYRDCEYFILPYMSHTNYTECLKNPYNFAHYFVYYNVTFYNDSTSLKTQSVRKGQAASAPLSPTKVGHTFTGWDRGFTNIQSNTSVYAVWEKTNQVTFLDYNGTTLKTEYVGAGESATPPSVTARPGYEFVGWSHSYTNVVQDVTTMAQYQALSYQVTFVDIDNQVLQSVSVNPNGSATPPVAPSLPGKTFVRWSVDTSKVTSDLTVSPVYQTIQYVVRFYDGNTLHKETTVDHGSPAIAPVIDKEGYVFTGWDQDFNSVTSVLTIQATWTIQQHLVTFYDETGQVLSTRLVDYGSSVEPPQYQPPVGQQLSHWDGLVQQVRSPLHIHPVLETAMYTVYYMDKETLLDEELLPHGHSCIGMTPIKEGHTFEGWDQACNNITSDVTLQARFTADEFVVRFFDFADTLIQTQTISYGQDAVLPEVEFPSYTFTGWSVPLTNITTDVDAYPLGEYRQYRVIVKDFDATTLCDEVVDYNTTITCSAPSREGYTFKGWTAPLTITEDITIFATYDPIYIKVNYMVDGVVMKSEQVQYGFPATPPNVSKTGYTFKEWNQSLSKITTPLTAQAVFDINQYMVVFNSDGVAVKEEWVPHGSDATPPPLVVKEGHIFSHWEGDQTAVTTHRALEAVFEKETYTVRFFVEGVPYQTQLIEYQSDATPPEIDIEGVEHIGWRGEFLTITQNTDIHAILKPQTVTVLFMDGDSVVSEQVINYGQAATAPDEGPWDQRFSRVTTDLIIQRSARPIPATEIEAEEEVIVEAMNEESTAPRLLVEVEQRSNRWRYYFDIDLQEYELRGIDGSITPVTFQSTTFFRDEITWLEFESEEWLEFELVHLNTQEVFAIEVVEIAPANSFIITQLWQQLLSFITGIFA
jgi:hypothetical protein